MNDTINPASSSQSKASVHAVSASTKSRLDERNTVDASDSSVSEKSFQDSIEKAFDDSQQEKEIIETEAGGNDLPLSNDLPDYAADDVRLLTMADLNSHINNQVTTKEKSPGQLSAQMQQLQKVETNIKAKNTQLISINTTVTTNISEKLVVQQQDISQMVLPDQKSQVLTTTIQQQGLSNTQTPLPAEFNNNASPLLLNPSVNNLSTMNLQPVPQAEIVETFARPAWSQGMGKQILLMVNQNISSAEIRLNPAHLGPIEVLIDMSEDQVNVSLSSRHAVVREAMEQALPKLREMLDANGFNLAETDISQHSFARQREQSTEDTNTALTGDSSDQLISSEINEQVIKHLSSSTSMVDYYI